MKVVFIDIEANPETKEVYDFAAVDENGKRIHTKNVLEFNRFLSEEEYAFVCGHNILDSDLSYLKTTIECINDMRMIDTLYLSPLLFPSWPYHKLLKDEKLWTDEKNNPLNDAVKTKDLFFEELEVYLNLDQELRSIYIELLNNERHFSGFFEYVEYKKLRKNKKTSKISIRSIISGIRMEPGLSGKILHLFHGNLCNSANLNKIIEDHPVELAYCLAVINSESKNLRMPFWVHRNFPVIENIILQLRGTPCEKGCVYCNNYLSAQSQLKKIFGYDSFRTFDGQSLQEDAVNAALQQKSLLAVFPTGGGKSLTFQLPAVILGNAVGGLTVIISPLQALMKDQVDNIERMGLIDAVTINGMQNPLERQDAMARVMNGSAAMLYLAPESLRSSSLFHMLLTRNVVRIVIDEAHCFSAWGHDFRVDYQFIGNFAKKLQKEKGLEQTIPVSCFTATAKQKVVSDIREYFRQTMALHLLLFVTEASRENLRYEVLYVNSDKEKSDHMKYQLLRELVSDRDCPTIVYASRTQKTEKLAEQLNRDGIPAVAYHGQMDASIKKNNQESFLENKVRAIVATSAFGMGVDKPDVQLIVHYNIPDSLENYIQEAGRAGRNPELQAECYILFNPNDLDDHFSLLNETKLTINDIQKVWAAIKKLSNHRERITASAFEIAEAAGFKVNSRDMETKVRSALNALELAKYIRRNQNMSFIYASSMKVNSQMEAIDRIDASGLFSEDEREMAKRITSSLFTSRTTYRNRGLEAESRTDYLADKMGTTRYEVTRIVNKLRQAEILKDDKDMTAIIESGRSERTNLKKLEEYSNLEKFILETIDEHDPIINLKKLNENAEQEGLKTNVKMIKTIVQFWSSRKYINKVYWGRKNEQIIYFRIPLQELIKKRELKDAIGEYIIHYLYLLYREKIHDDKNKNDKKVIFSAKEIMDSCNMETMFTVSIDDIEESLLFLLKIGSIIIEGGFLVLYSPLFIQRIEKNNKTKYKIKDYSGLEEYYQLKIQQIHIISEFANIMTRDYDKGMIFIKDYFQMNYRKFITKYFDKKRQKEIKRNVTPQKYLKISESLSNAQKQIIDDDESQFIVVMAGPGSGKTRVLVHKLASLLTMENVKTEDLLMLTFSRAAATEFKVKLIELIGKAAFFVEIRTFHSYCFDLLGKTGNLDESDNIIEETIRRIQNDEVEMERISKSVVVIDEAQDMDENSYSLLQELIRRNQSMRVIAVGDDDQNIYKFRGSDSKYFNSLVTDYHASTYDLLENYRSDAAIIRISNYFIRTIQNRMKSLSSIPVRTEEGSVCITKHLSPNYELSVIDEIMQHRQKGSVCIMTNTNFQASQMVSLLNRYELPAELIQSNDGFDVFDMVEMRYFFRQFDSCHTVILPEIWSEAIKKLSNKYKTSENLPICLKIIEDFSKIHNKYFKTDLEVYLHEVKLDGYNNSNMNTITVSTIHKTKGKEFDHVYMMIKNFDFWDNENKKVLYVGMTRAKESLSIHYHGDFFDSFQAEGIDKRLDPVFYNELNEIVLQLGFRDVYLDLFKNDRRKEYILKHLRCGDPLIVEGNYFYSQDPGINYPLAQLSRKSQSEVQNYIEKGFNHLEGRVRYIVAWHPKNEENNQEFAVILPSIILRKH